MHRIIDALETSIYWKNLNGEYLGCNKYMLKMAGFDFEKEMIGKTDYQLPWKDHAEQIRKNDLIAIKNGYYECEELPLIIGNNNKCFLTIKTRLTDDSGKVIGVVGNSIDITYRVLKEKLEQKNKILTNKNKLYETIIKRQENLRKLFDNLFRIQQSEIMKFMNQDIGIDDNILDEYIPLSKREFQILYLLYYQKSPKSIANYLSKKENTQIAYSTINAIINKQLYVKFNVGSIDKLIEKAILLKMIPLILPNSGID